MKIPIFWMIWFTRERGSMRVLGRVRESRPALEAAPHALPSYAVITLIIYQENAGWVGSLLMQLRGGIAEPNAGLPRPSASTAGPATPSHPHFAHRDSLVQT